MTVARTPSRSARRRKSSPSARVLEVTLREHLLPEQVTLVVEPRHVAHVDAGQREGSLLVEGLERGQHELTGRREHDG